MVHCRLNSVQENPMPSKHVTIRKALRKSQQAEHPLSLIETLSTTHNFFSKTGFFSLNFFDNKDLGHLASASRTFYPVVKEAQEQRLLSHVIQGRQLAAQAIIEVNPSLLLVKSKAVDYSGRTIIATPFQAALGAGDKPMWEMMLKFMEPEEALRQFREWFPNGIEEAPAKLSIDYEVLANAIIGSDDGGLLAIQQFRNVITSQKEITYGAHFDLRHLLAAYQAYLNHFDALGPDWAKRDLFWKQVIGYVQRQMTAYDAQIHCSGVQSVLDNAQQFSRNLKFDNGQDFFPAGSDSGLGFDFACYSGGRHWVTARSLSMSGPVLKNYVEQKQMHLQDLESHLSKECVISRRSCVCS